MFDSHTHLDYLSDPASARGELGLTGMVCIGASLIHAQNAIKLAEMFPDVWATVGIHPTESDLSAHREELEGLALHPRVVAIGETGIDAYHDTERLNEQTEAFEWQMRLAARLKKPIVIHTRDREGSEVAHRRVIEVLRAHPEVIAILHCFSGHAGLLEYGLAHGCYFSFAGNVTYKKAHDIQNAARVVPSERLLLETDAPFLAPVPKRGKPNRPGYVRYTLEYVAGLRGITPETLEAITDQNARQVFGLSERLFLSGFLSGNSQ